MKKILIALFIMFFVSPLSLAQDTLRVKSFNDLDRALERKIAPLEQLKLLPHENCNCEKCMTIKNKVAADIDAIYIDTSQLRVSKWHSNIFHQQINRGIKNIENINNLGDKIRSGKYIGVDTPTANFYAHKNFWKPNYRRNNMSFGFLVPVSLFILVGWIVKTIFDNKIRKRALENGNLNESIKYLWEKSYANKPRQNIKWAVIFSGVGVVILFAHIFALAEAVAIGLSFIIVGTALVIYYYYAEKKKE